MAHYRPLLTAHRCSYCSNIDAANSGNLNILLLVCEAVQIPILVLLLPSRELLLHFCYTLIFLNRKPFTSSRIGVAVLAATSHTHSIILVELLSSLIIVPCRMSALRVRYTFELRLWLVLSHLSLRGIMSSRFLLAPLDSLLFVVGLKFGFLVFPILEDRPWRFMVAHIIQTLSYFYVLFF